MKRKSFLESTRAVFCLCLVFLFVPLSVKSQQICFAYKGEWSSWGKIYGNTYRYVDGTGFEIQNYGGVVYLKFQITNYTPPTKAEIKAHEKSQKWFEYGGIVEYYVSDEYPTAKDVAKACNVVIPDARHDVTPKVKRVAYATIKIAPYKKVPYCYNLFFDGIGIGFTAYGKKYGDVKLK